ncbi:MAG: flagellar basal body P-ring formation protein FlgA [Bdellovibrionales bacterium]|nr:flagellar basal body P-ring formation protein FlgA [Bdellovibrionales bacterium]
MSKKQLSINLLLIFLLSIYLQARAADANILNIHFKKVVIARDSQVINVLDLIENQNIPQPLKAKLKNIILGDSPLTGEKRVFTDQTISQALIKNKIVGKRFKINIPSKIQVIHPKVLFTKEEVEARLVKNWNEFCHKCEFKIKDLRVPEVLSKDFSHWSLNVRDQLPQGPFSISVFVEAKNSSKTFWVSGTAEIYRYVPVAKKLISFSQNIAEDDIEIKLRNVTYLMDKGMAQSSDLIGRKAKRTISNDQIIWVNDVERTKAMRRGDIVNVMIGGSNWSVQLKGLALEDGYLGDVIKVKNIKTDKLFTAKVIGMGEAVVQ